jgi:hypothetical protein
VQMYGPVADQLRMCGWGPYAREASVWEACCWYSGLTSERWRGKEWTKASRPR